MKAFQFRLEQALRWREAQLNVQQARVSAAAARRDSIRRQLEKLNNEAKSAAIELIENPVTGAFEAFAAYAERSRNEIGQLESGALDAERALAGETARLMEAHLKREVLDRFKSREKGRWQADFNCEIEAFAAESFLARLR